MNDIITTEKPQLPATIPELKKFILFGTEKIKVVHSEILLINSLNLAQEVKKQKENEMIELSKLIIEAELKIKEYLETSFKPFSQEIKKEKEKLGITKKENDRMCNLRKYKDEINNTINELVLENKIPLPVKVNSRIRVKILKDNNKTSRAISKDDIHYYEYAIECLRDYRKRFFNDLKKQHKIFKTIQVLEKLIYKE